MMRTILVILIAAAATIGGCKKQPPVVEPSESSEVSITEDNLDAELDKMETEIDADIAAEEQ
jgi:hypothetical protein